jgi:hypothetical protein
MIRSFLSLAALAALGATSAAQQESAKISVTGGKHDMKDVIIKVPLPDELKGEIAATNAAKSTLAGQAAPPSLLSPGAARELHILIPEIKAGQTIELTAAPAVHKGKGKLPVLQWTVVDGLEQLEFVGRPLVRYFHKEFDPSLSQKGKEIANPTIKPYHHLFAPDGKTLVTNSNEGQYPHHRGIFYGFNNISYDGKKADVWHCRTGESTRHEMILASEAKNLFGRQTVQIGWYGQDGKLFANEKRELTVYPFATGTLIDFASILTTPLERVRLDGDPQHAGFHFRANSVMEKNTKETVFIRPEGKGNPGAEKNWDPKTKKGPVDLTWDAMSFVLDGKRYTVLYLDHPDNPKEARQSERCYGRIGTYFEYDLTKEKPLKVRYRLWFHEGEPTVEQCEALSQAFVHPPSASIVRR